MEKQSHTNILLSGAFAGIAEGLAVQPLDMVKTRFQLNHRHNTSIRCTVSSLLTEGGFFRLYRGLLPELAGMVPKTATMYASYDACEHYLINGSLIGSIGEKTTLIASTSGFVAGIVEACTVQPFQVVKVRLQAKEHLGRYNSTIDCIRKIQQQEGFIRGFSTGLSATIARNCVWNSIYFGIINEMTTKILINTSDNNDNKNNKASKGMITFFSGFVGGTIATCFNAPFDVVKSRLQSQLPINNSSCINNSINTIRNNNYNGVLSTLYRIYKEEGYQSLYKGFTPKVLRMGIGGAVCIATFDVVKHTLS